MKIAAIISYTPDKAKIQEARPAHRQYLMGKLGEGKIAISGPLTDDSGGIIVYEAGSAAEAEEILKADPFAKAGVFVSWELKPWNPIICNRDLLPA